MNSNLVHNILNIAIAVTAAATAFLMATGCVDTGTTITCEESWINPTWAAGAVAVMGVVKTGINLVRDGLKGLTKTQPPVE